MKQIRVIRQLYLDDKFLGEIHIDLGNPTFIPASREPLYFPELDFVTYELKKLYDKSPIFDTVLES